MPLTPTHQNKVFSWWPQGGNDPAQRFITPRLIANGWIAETQFHLDNGDTTFQPDETWVSIPFGAADTNAYDFCGLQACTGPLARVADIGEFQQGFGLYYKQTRRPVGFYMGNAQADPTLNPLWDTDRFAWYLRVEAAIAPMALLAAQGIPIKWGLDAAGDGIGADQEKALADHLLTYGPVSIEPRPLYAGAVFNSVRYGTITIDSEFRDDYPFSPVSTPIPAAQLVGRKMIIAITYPSGQPASYAAYVRKLGTFTGGDIAVITNQSMAGNLTAANFRVTLPA